MKDYLRTIAPKSVSNILTHKNSRIINMNYTGVSLRFVLILSCVVRNSSCPPSGAGGLEPYTPNIAISIRYKFKI